MSTNIPRKTPDATELLPDFYPSVRVASAKDGAPFYTSIAAAHKYPQWMMNDHKALCVLVVDIDRDNWVLPLWELVNDYPELLPSWYIEKCSNGHGQIGWIIEHVATGENAPGHPIRYAKAVLYALTKAFDGDEGYVNSRCWNPTWDGWAAGKGDVRWGLIEPRPLGMIYEALQRAGLWTTKPRNRRPAPALDSSAAPGRNCHVFDVARLRARGSVADAAHAANDALPIPLSLSELNWIIRSIERFEAVNGPPWDRRGGYSVKYMSEEERERQRERGRRGGLVNSQKQQEARAKGPQTAALVRSAEAVGRAATARKYKDEGLSNKEIAQRMDASLASVKRWLRQTRTDATTPSSSEAAVNC